MIKIKTTKQNRLNNEVNFGVCSVEFDHTGCGNVDDEFVDVLLSKDPTLSVVGEVKTSKADPNEGLSEEQIKEKEEAAALEAEKESKLAEGLLKLDKDDLIAICAQLKPINDLKKMKPENIVKLIMEKLNHEDLTELIAASTDENTGDGSGSGSGE